MSEIALLLDEIRGMKRRLQALETVQEHPGFAASDVARLSIANTFEDDVTVEGDLTVDLDATITGDVLAAGIVQAAAAWIPGVAVSLDAKLYCNFNGDEPFETDYTGSSTGHRGQPGTETGGVIYRPGKFGKAVQVAEATTNFFSNPSFETNTSSWPVEASATIARTSADALYGSYCADYARTGSAASSMYNTHTISGATAGRVFTHSGWVKAKTASDVGKTLSILIFEVGGASASAYSSTSVVLTNEWQRITLTRTVVQNDRTSIQSRFQLGSNGNCYVDGAQLEEKAYATPYCDGSLGSGHSWSGTAHASWSSRTAASLGYSTSALRSSAGTIGMWAKCGSSSTTYARILAHYNSGNRIYIIRRNSDGVWFAGVGDTALLITGTAVDSGWHHFALSWNGSSATFYIDGVSMGTSAYTNLSAFGTYIYLTGYPFGDADNHLIDDFVVLSRVASADEIRAIYESNAQLICS